MMALRRRSKTGAGTRGRDRADAAPGAPRALYLAVKDHVRGKIRAGDWRPGQRISSEHELVAELGVSRMTVNRALRELADRGELVRHAGVGTFVGEGWLQSGLLHVGNIADEVRARGHGYSCDVVLAARERASPEVAAALGLPAGDEVYHTVCVHRENGVPIQLEDRYLVESRGSAPPDPSAWSRGRIVRTGILSRRRW